MGPKTDPNRSKTWLFEVYFWIPFFEGFGSLSGPLGSLLCLPEFCVFLGKVSLQFFGSSKSTEKPSDYCSYCELPWQYIAWHCIFCGVLEGSYILTSPHACVQNGLSISRSMSTRKVLPSDYVVDSCGAIVVSTPVRQIAALYDDGAFLWRQARNTMWNVQIYTWGIMWNANVQSTHPDHIGNLMRPLQDSYKALPSPLLNSSGPFSPILLATPGPSKPLPQGPYKSLIRVFSRPCKGLLRDL